MRPSSYVFTKRHSACTLGNKPAVLTDSNSGGMGDGRTYDQNTQLSGLGMNARSFVLRHLQGRADGLPGLEKDASITEDLFDVAFAFATRGVDPVFLQIAELIASSRKEGKQIPAIQYGPSHRHNRVLR